MKTIRKMIVVVLVAALLPLCVCVPSALAAGAASVWVNNMELTASAQYLANGSTLASATPPASGGYAYFNSATSTLTLNNAVINTPYEFVMLGISTWYMVFAVGDLTIDLVGENSISYTLSGHSYSSIFGIGANNGSLMIGGTGSLKDLHIINSSLESYAIGLYAGRDLTIGSGSLNIIAQATESAYGIVALNVIVTGGQTQIEAIGRQIVHGIELPGTQFRMTAGTLSVTATASYATAIPLYYVNDISMEGGDATFSGSAPSEGYGAMIYSDTVNYSGGNFTYIGAEFALRREVGGAITYNLTDGAVYVSENTDGSSLRLWSAAADGALENSAFRYVKFVPIYKAAADIPQTGDSFNPWLWAVIAVLCTLLGAAGAGLTAIKRRRRLD